MSDCLAFALLLSPRLLSLRLLLLAFAIRSGVNIDFAALGVDFGYATIAFAAFAFATFLLQSTLPSLPFGF